MSFAALKNKQEPPLGTSWAERLIPGTATLSGATVKKPPHSVRLGPARVTSEPQEEARAGAVQVLLEVLTMLLPRPVARVASWNQARLIAVDLLFIATNWFLIGAVGLWLRASGFWGGESHSWPESLIGIALFHGALITLLAFTEGFYRDDWDGDLRQQGLALGKALLWATVLMTAACWNSAGVPIGILWAAAALHGGVLLGRRWERQKRTSRCTQAARGARRVLIAGAGRAGQGVASYVESHPRTGYKMCGFLDESAPLGRNVIGRVEELAQVARTEFVDEVIIAMPKSRDLALRVVREARQLHLDVKVVPDLYGYEPTGTEVEFLGRLPLISLHEERLPAAGLLLKRSLDVLAAAGLLIVAAPLMAVLALLIRLDSKGPAIYTALRVGRKGQRFRCYKFRTMVMDADSLKEVLRERNQRQGPCFKMADDPRITRVGRFLRRYSLDELPQLWNVLRGDMSLVGPRPHPVDDFAEYQMDHLRRLDVTPGLTGLWQVTARRDRSFQKNMALDLEYIERWSLGMDLRILLKTMAVVVKGDGE